jgi:hypothetical protein
MMLSVIVGNLRLIARDHYALQTVTGYSKRPVIQKKPLQFRIKAVHIAPTNSNHIIRRLLMLRSHQNTSLPLFMESTLTIVGFLCLVCLL